MVADVAYHFCTAGVIEPLDSSAHVNVKIFEFTNQIWSLAEQLSSFTAVTPGMYFQKKV